ncbi:uncharacterized protein LOC123548334 [Mercenaria mercenaria]|uniref:uncharacterized protein LOC123548334 n=1 Tax=Mercenaria mercenaria TaxID=6596 RepID=UPI00234F67B2|nr:uncharacterized protein LOC123548334 [Mercenaria mercenaria]XP_053402502.1 uncharacterized protein LOC123548334 [Mercenaria mercenaria]
MGFLSLLWLPVRISLNLIEKFLFILINLYDTYCYSPLQTTLSPVVARIPRAIHLGDRKVDVFTANIVSWSRTILVIPVAWCLKYNYPVTAFLCVILHDFLDHLDGIVAKVQKSIYGQIDDPLLGGFMDAFCDKIVNCVSLWTILMVTDFSKMTASQTLLFTGACAVIIAYEFVLGVVRVQDYFQAYYSRKYKAVSTESKTNVAAVMEGKLKEKLESMGIGCLCLAQGAAVPISSISGIIGVICLLLSIRLAHASLDHKLKPRREKQSKIEQDEGTECRSFGTQTEEKLTVKPERQMSIFGDLVEDPDDLDEKSDTSSEKEEEVEEMKMSPSHRKLSMKRSQSVPSWKILQKVDKVYTVGCFDLFHEGHKILMERLKELGKQVIVGVHDSRSIFKLKKRVPIDSTYKRMSNVKNYADVVYCISGTDPTQFLKCIFDVNEPVTSMYVRGDDMPNFPARKFIEEVMPVHFLPYSEFVSSTKIRKEVYNASMFGPHVNDDDHIMFY